MCGLRTAFARASERGLPTFGHPGGEHRCSSAAAALASPLPARAADRARYVRALADLQRNVYQFLFNDAPTTEGYHPPLHDARPNCGVIARMWTEHGVHALVGLVDRLVVLPAGGVVREGEPQAATASPA